MSIKKDLGKGALVIVGIVILYFIGTMTLNFMDNNGINTCFISCLFK